MPHLSGDREHGTSFGVEDVRFVVGPGEFLGEAKVFFDKVITSTLLYQRIHQFKHY
jgi:hypothetical protein